MRNKSLLSLAFARRYRSLIKSIASPFFSQEKVFRFLIQQGSKTTWGKMYDYKNIKSYKDYQERVPINTYETLSPYIERILAGEDYVLWPKRIKYFSKSSGTTSSKSKYIPVSAEALKNNHYLGGRNLFASYLQNRSGANLFLGRNFVLGGSRQDFNIGQNKYIADVSVILMKELPWWAKLRRSPRFCIATLSEWEEKLERMAQIISKQNITSLSGTPSWNLVLAKKVLEITGKDNLKQVWPNLELFIHGGTSFSPYREQFKELIPDEKMSYLEVYNASEGFFAFQDDLAKDDLLLFLNGGVFYEFLPLVELGKEKPKALTLAEVELNKNYALIISTNSGLWRYLIGDTIRFTSLSPFKIIITGRTKSFINACGEELVVENADQAISAAALISRAQVKEYTAAPLFLKNQTAAASHQWLIEFSQPPQDLNLFQSALEKELKLRNSDYEAKRYKDLNLGPPILIEAKKDLFYNWLKDRRRISGQAKIPRLSNNREIIEELLLRNN
jgi:hypothetical protein